MTYPKLWIVISLALALGCSEKKASQTSGGDDNTGAAGESNSGTGSDGPMTCEFGATETPCASADSCSIVEAWQVSCDDPGFGVLGMQVGATSDAVYLGANAWNDTRVWRLGGEGGEGGEGGGGGEASEASEDLNLPITFDESPIAFAVAADDSLYVLGAWASRLDEDSVRGFQLIRVRGTAGTRLPVFYDDGLHYYYDLALGPDDVPHVWLDSYDFGGEALARLADDGEWDVEAPSQTGIGWPRASLSDAGEVVAFGLEGGRNGYRVIARYDGEDHPLGSDFSGRRYRPIDPPVPLAGSDTTLDYAVITQSTDALRVAWVAEGEASEVVVPSSAKPDYECALGSVGDPPCSGPCTETAPGIEYEAFAATRGTSDIWVAYLIQNTDRVIEYAIQERDAPTCVGNISKDRSTSELVIQRIPIAGGDPSEVSRVPLGYIGRFEFLEFAATDVPPVAIHAFGDRIAVAARTETSTQTYFTVLLLEAD